jgi:hypothetical protein
MKITRKIAADAAREAVRFYGRVVIPQEPRVRKNGDTWTVEALVVMTADEIPEFDTGGKR